MIESQPLTTDPAALLPEVDTTASQSRGYDRGRGSAHGRRMRRRRVRSNEKNIPKTQDEQGTKPELNAGVNTEGYREPFSEPVKPADCNDPTERPCRHCGVLYRPKRNWVNAAPGKEPKFCSEKCSDTWHNRYRQSESPVLDRLDVDRSDFEELYLVREQLIQLEKIDPWRHGFVPPHWLMADEQLLLCDELLVSGGNRAGKTLWAARKCIEFLLGGENRNVICCHTSHPTSVAVQQPAIYNYLPAELKQTKKGRIHYLNYSRKNGFTDNSFILHNGSRCDFLNYTQSENTIEGRDGDFVWCDELVPQSWIETLRFRLITRRGKLVVTQTPIEGVASVYKEITAGGKVTRWDDAPLLIGKPCGANWPPGQAPRLLESVNKRRRAVFFFTSDNPYQPYEELVSRLSGAAAGQILVRAYGWASDQVGKAFARFRPDIHVIPPSRVPAGGTLYQVVDPAGARNWFTLWARVYEDGKVIIVKEFPDYGSFGEWALPGDKPDGKIGPAQTVGAGQGLPQYRSMYRAIEAELGGTPLQRLIDPKAGGTPAISNEGGTTLIDLLATSEDPDDEGMIFFPSPGVPTDQRIAAINSALSYDATQPLTPINEPKLYVVEDCINLIWCLSEYTGRDGLKGAAKDPIDCLGMLLTSSSDYVGEHGLESVGGGSY